MSMTWGTWRAGVVALMALASMPAVAQGHAHVHGQAQLEAVLDGAELQLTLTSPLDSIVGFEHKPRTAAQRQAAERALRTLVDPPQLFLVPAAAGSVTAPSLGAEP